MYNIKIIKILTSLLNILFLFLILFVKTIKKLKIGVVGVRHEVNIGNNLIKYAMFIKLSELGFEPYIIGTHYNNFNITLFFKILSTFFINYFFSSR